MNGNKLVCHISFNHSPFDDRIYWKELLSLKEAGYETVHIAVGDHDSDFISEEGVRIIIIKKEILFKPFKKFPLINKGLQALFNKKGTINTILKVAASLSASVYHYHDLQINTIAKALKNLPHKPKVIYDAHEAYHLLMLEETPIHFLKKFFYKRYVSLITKWELSNAAHCDYIIATDEYTLDFFSKKLPSIKSNIIYNYSYFLPHLFNKEVEKEYDLIYTGLISKNRGIEEILKSVSCLQQTLPQIKILLIGNFETSYFKEYVIHLIFELGIQKNVMIKDAVPFSQISNFYCKALVGLGIFHNTPKYNKFIPIKLFEYMAFGLPVIFSNHGPSAQIVKESACGTLVNYGDLQNITSAMTTILSDKNLYEIQSRNGKHAVATNYNWAKEKVKLLDLYKNIDY